MITYRKDNRGITFVEMVVIIGIYTVLMGAVFTSIFSFYQFNGYTIAQANEVESARRGVDRAVRDMREMTYADDGTFPLARMEEHAVGFYSDIDRDDSVEYVEFELSSTTMFKYVYNATGNPPVYDTSTPDETFTLSEFVQNINQGSTTFRYYTGDGTEATASTLLTDIRYLEVAITVNIDPQRNPSEFVLRSSAAPRNLKDNL
ncbi:MAG: hypothetical protein AAGA35_03900 [Patescibacteria group bacterium]